MEPYLTSGATSSKRAEATIINRGSLSEGSHRSYRERQYRFGGHILQLRTRVGLTQSALAEQVGAHRRSVQNWETGASYPKADMLRRLVALLLERHAFTPGDEHAEAHELWTLAVADGLDTLPPFDEGWFAHIRRQGAGGREQGTTPLPEPRSRIPDPRPLIDWGEALAVPYLYGREHELETLQHWIVDDRCRVVSIVGMGGMGKSSLAITAARAFLPLFDTVIFRSLQNGPPLADVLDMVIRTVSDEQVSPPVPIADKIARLVQLFRERRCLLVLDNVESIMQPGALTGTYREGYAEYGALLQSLGEREHGSCMLLTSREKVTELALLEGATVPVRALVLQGLNVTSSQSLLEARDVRGSIADIARLAELYGGNPLALRLIAEPIRELFQGDLATFLALGEAFFQGVSKLLAQHFARSTPLEQVILYWLTIERELISLHTLFARVGNATSQREVLAAVESLRRRLLIERAPDRPAFSLQPMILEYLTEQLVEEVYQELVGRQPCLLQSHALVQATNTEYARQSQERRIALPLLERLTSTLNDADRVQAHLQLILEELRQAAGRQGYGPGNIVNLLRLLRGHGRGLDLAGLTIRQAYLQGIDLQDANFAGATVQESVFSETFDDILAVAISGTGSHWASASRRGEIRVWEDDGRTLRHVWRAHTDATWALVWSADGRSVASGSWNGTIKVWDVASGALRWEAEHGGHMHMLAFAPNGHTLASSGPDATVRLWDATLGTLLKVLPHPTSVLPLTWSPDGGLLASGDVAGNIHVWEVCGPDSVRCVQVLTAHTALVDGLAFAPGGGVLASASWDGTVKLWDVASGRLQHTLSGHTGSVKRVIWSPDGRTLASAGEDQTIWLWDVEHRSYRAVLRGHSAAVTGLAFTPDGRTLISGSEDSTVRVWDVATSQCLRVMQGCTASVYDVGWHPDGTQLVSGGTDRRITVHALDQQRPSRVFHGESEVAFGVSWSPDGRTLASSEWDNVIRLWNVGSGTCDEVIHHPDDAGNYFYAVAWNPADERLACGTARRGVLVWDVKRRRKLWDGGAFPCWIRSVAWRPDGTQLAGGGDDGSVYVWDAGDGALLRRLSGHHGMITCLAWSPDGTYLASSSGNGENGELWVWDARGWEQVQTLVGHAGVVSAVAWGQDEQHLVSGGADGVLRWWDVRSGACLRVCKAHQGTVHALRRSPDGTQLASCGDDGAAAVWNIRSGEYLQTLRRDRPYERMNIADLGGLTAAQRASLLALGAVETPTPKQRELGGSGT